MIHAPFAENLSGPENAFRLLSVGQPVPVLHPVRLIRPLPREGLLGLDEPLRKLLRNLASFDHGASPVSTLLYGFRGTGKTSLLLAAWGETLRRRKEAGMSPCRLIQIEREGIPHLLPLIDRLGDRPECALIVFDDLYFPPDDPLFHLFRAFLDGGIAGLPPNVGLAVTSNHRHLVSESFARRDDALHPGETMDDSLALWDRFGLALLFSEPGRDAYLDLVLAKLIGKGLLPSSTVRPPSPNGEESDPLGPSKPLAPSDSLEGIVQRALLFSRTRASRSGRTAQWFADLFERGLVDGTPGPSGP